MCGKIFGQRQRVSIDLKVTLDAVIERQTLLPLAVKGIHIATESHTLSQQTVGQLPVILR